MGNRNALNKEVSSSEDKNKTKIKTATTNNNKKKRIEPWKCNPTTALLSSIHR